MNPRTIIESIAQSRILMDAQVNKLDEFTPTFIPITLAQGNAQASAAQLLNSAIYGHLQGAMDTLHALSQVKSPTRNIDCSNTIKPSVEIAQREGEIIEGEFAVINDPRRAT